jgi:diguanylate cyclase (GGDEF)-like protein/hemerythrin-like metal-binding protein
METNYLIITLIVLSSIYAVINLLIYQVKKEHYLLAFTLSFVLLGISYAILAYQTRLPAFFAYGVYNAVNFMSYVMILMGIRIIFDLRPVSRLAIALTLTSLILILFFSLVVYNYVIRVVVVSSTIAFYLIEAIFDLKRAESKFPEQIKKVTLYFIYFGMTIWLVRLFVILYFGVIHNLSLNNNFQANIFMILSITISSLWFALSMWLDTQKSMNDLDEKNEQLKSLALRDQLTGLANRHYFDYDIEFLLASSKRNMTPMGMLLIDLDRFKLVNDIHGHDVGDMVLKQTAEIIRNSLRASDRAYRWGGEEFLVVLPDTDHAGMVAIAEKINQNFRNSVFDVIGSITVSIGGAEYEDGEETDFWFKRVDLSLYRAKQNGRDRHEIWVADEDLPEYFSRVEWSSQLESGNKDIDADHQLLFYYVNDLHDSITNRVPIDTIKELILRMSNHIHSHFSKEEGILFRSGYEEYIEHRSIHQRILQEYEIIASKAINGEISLAAIMSFLVEKVVLKHIVEDDGKFFNKL